MIVNVLKEDLTGITHLCGGEFAVNRLDITVDCTLSIREQREMVYHAIIENYCPSWDHSKVDDLTDLIREGIDQLEEKDDTSI